MDLMKELVLMLFGNCHYNIKVSNELNIRTRILLQMLRRVAKCESITVWNTYLFLVVFFHR